MVGRLLLLPVRRGGREEREVTPRLHGGVVCDKIGSKNDRSNEKESTW